MNTIILLVLVVDGVIIVAELVVLIFMIKHIQKLGDHIGQLDEHLDQLGDYTRQLDEHLKERSNK
jgi:phosphate uptake regulator